MIQIEKTSRQKKKKITNDDRSSVVLLYFLDEPKNIFVFGSLAAIYTMFSADFICVALPTLYNQKLSPKKYYENGKVHIERTKIIRKSKNK